MIKAALEFALAVLVVGLALLGAWVCVVGAEYSRAQALGVLAIAAYCARIVFKEETADMQRAHHD